MRTLVVIGILASPAPGIAQHLGVPVQFQGRWASSLERCQIPHEGSLTISEDRIDFYESRGRVLFVRVISPLEVELEIESTGEGQTWRHVRRFLLSDDKRSLTDLTYQDAVHRFSRVRCG
jgi:hypothetical protein